MGKEYDGSEADSSPRYRRGSSRLKKIKANGRTPFSIEIKIMDEKGKKIFHWKESRGNLRLGIEKTTEFISNKLGIEEVFNNTEILKENLERENNKLLSLEDHKK